MVFFYQYPMNCFRTEFCTARITWARDNLSNWDESLVWIMPQMQDPSLDLDLQSSMLPLCHSCPLNKLNNLHMDTEKGLQRFVCHCTRPSKVMTLPPRMTFWSLYTNHFHCPLLITRFYTLIPLMPIRLLTNPQAKWDKEWDQGWIRNGIGFVLSL